jgi:hypothetical protein
MNASLRLSTSVAVSLCEARPLDVLYRVCRAAQPPSLTFGVPEEVSGYSIDDTRRKYPRPKERRLPCRSCSES